MKDQKDGQGSQPTESIQPALRVKKSAVVALIGKDLFVALLFSIVLLVIKRLWSLPLPHLPTFFAALLVITIALVWHQKRSLGKITRGLVGFSRWAELVQLIPALLSLIVLSLILAIRVPELAVLWQALYVLRYALFSTIAITIGTVAGYWLFARWSFLASQGQLIDIKTTKKAIALTLVFHLIAAMPMIASKLNNATEALPVIAQEAGMEYILTQIANGTGNPAPLKVTYDGGNKYIASQPDHASSELSEKTRERAKSEIYIGPEVTIRGNGEFSSTYEADSAYGKKANREWGNPVYLEKLPRLYIPHDKEKNVKQLAGLLLEKRAWEQQTPDDSNRTEELQVELTIEYGGAQSTIWEYANDFGRNERVSEIFYYLLENFRIEYY